MTAAPTDRDDEAARRRVRLRWRARRGLLENDLLLTRFLDRHGERLTEADVAGLTALLDLPDNVLLDLILRRSELEPALARPEVLGVLERLRSA